MARPALRGNQQAAVAVVGGGLAGLHTALALAEKGITDVKIVESGHVGWGSSGMSKGLAVAGIQVPLESLAAQSSPAVAATVYELSDKAQLRLKALIKKYKIRCDVTAAGGLDLSIYPPAEEDKDETFLPKEQAAALSGSSLYKCGWFDSGSFGLNPLGLTRGLARSCESLGVQIYESTTAVEIMRRSSSGSDDNKHRFSLRII